MDDDVEQGISVKVHIKSLVNLGPTINVPKLFCQDSFFSDSNFSDSNFQAKKSLQNAGFFNSPKERYLFFSL
jgi:hypothetical protein